MMRSGCSYAPAMKAFPLMLIRLFSLAYQTLRHQSDVRTQLELQLGQRLDLGRAEARGDLLEHEAAVAPAQERQVGDHQVDTAQAGQRVAALAHQFGTVV